MISPPPQDKTSIFVLPLICAALLIQNEMKQGILFLFKYVTISYKPYAWFFGNAGIGRRWRKRVGLPKESSNGLDDFSCDLQSKYISDKTIGDSTQQADFRRDIWLGRIK